MKFLLILDGLKNISIKYPEIVINSDEKEWKGKIS